jgi:hypothetical protein
MRFPPPLAAADRSPMAHRAEAADLAADLDALLLAVHRLRPPGFRESDVVGFLDAKQQITRGLGRILGKLRLEARDRPASLPALGTLSRSEARLRAAPVAAIWPAPKICPPAALSPPPHPDPIPELTGPPARVPAPRTGRSRRHRYPTPPPGCTPGFL